MDNNDELVKKLAYQLYLVDNNQYVPQMTLNQFVIRSEISYSYIEGARKIIRTEKLNRLFK